MPQQPLIVLMYHAVVDAPLQVPDWCFLSADEFGRQMEWLADRRCVVSLESALHGSPRGEARAPAVAVTFDDGFRNNYDIALPVLQRFEIPATIFLPTAFVDSDVCLWFCRINRAVANATLDAIEWDGERYELSSTAARAASSARIQARLKEFSQPKLLTELDRVCRSLGDSDSTKLGPDSPYATLSTPQIKAMSASGLVKFGAHSETHAILSLLDTETKSREIRRSIEKVDELAGERCSMFAYPNGRQRDFDAECVELLRAEGIEAAFTAVDGINDEATPRMELRRVGIGADATLEEFQSLLSNFG